MKLRLGIDVGGTFTDLIAFDEELGAVVAIRKYLSDPIQPMSVAEKIARDLVEEFGSSSVSMILHGSTVALNTLLEGKGADVGLLTTRGFRDVYEIGRQWRGQDVFNFFAPAPKMLLTRDRIYEVSERMAYQGDVLEPLVAEDVVLAARKLLAEGVQTIAVSFLFSYANPSHENEAARIIREVAPNVHVSLSSEVNPEWREYERTASTVANAYIGPSVSRYLQAFEKLFGARFPSARVLVMKSDGGAASAAMLSRTPIQTILSGPVAGVIASRYLGDVVGIENLISFDAGGTSSDMAVIPGRPLYKSEVSIARHPVRTHAVDIDTIGAGGGSIASIQFGGVLKVGPQSAGANPGPACYDRGGTEATLTDALVVLGHLNPNVLLEGEMRISSPAALAAVTRHVAEPLGMSAVEAAWGILTVLSTNVMSAMRTITVERGYDPREFTLIPFGGIGPTIAGKIATELAVGSILIPRDPGTFSAYGMLVTDVVQQRNFTRITRLSETSAAGLETIYRELEESVTADLLREKIPHGRLECVRSAGMRYFGQSYEVSVPVFALRGAEDLADLEQRFHAAHKKRYGHMAEGQTVEIVNYKVSGIGTIPKPEIKKSERRVKMSLQPEQVREAFFDPAVPIPVPVYRRSRLEAGMRIDGPAIIEEKTSTAVIYPRQKAEVDEFLNLRIQLENSK